MDKINALFEAFGAVAVLPSIVKAYRSKIIRGVSIITPLFFASWGFWNIIYYPSLDQLWSAAAAVFLAATNSTWLAQVWMYRKGEGGL